MGDALSPMPRARLYERVVQRLRAYAAEAGLRAGGRLPSERDLAARLGVSRVSVRQALVVLEVQGLVEVRHGGGVFLLRDSLDAEPIETLLARRRLLPEVFEAREAIETKLAELAALRRTDDDLAAIDQALREMRADIDGGGLGLAGDRQFHDALAAAAHNALLRHLLQAMAEHVRESRRESLRQPGRPERSLAQHAAIAAAVRDGDPDAAASAMLAHVRAVSEVRLLTWQPEPG